MQKGFKLKKSFASNFISKFKIALHNSAAQRKATNFFLSLLYDGT